jgi:hypothetical protein
VNGIEQIDKIIEYSNRISRAGISGRNHAVYILENPERTAEKIKELCELRERIVADDIDKSYKENFLQSIGNSLNYFNNPKKSSYNIPDSLLFVGLGIFLGVLGMNAFDGAMKGFGESMSKDFERKVYEKLEGELSG